MSTQTFNEEIEQFLDATFGSKEIGLIVVKDKKELEFIAVSLEEKKYSPAKSALNIHEFEKTYLVLNEQLDKETYDYLVQYSTGQIEIFNKEILESKIIVPEYQTSALILLILEEELSVLESNGMSILAIAGPVFRA